MDQRILALGSSDGIGPSFHQYLTQIFLRVHNPLELKFKQIMIEFQLANEGELFSCDLKFRLYTTDEDDKGFY